MKTEVLSSEEINESSRSIEALSGEYEEERPKNLRDCLIWEMRRDLEGFSEESGRLVRKFIDRKPFAGREQAAFDRARNNWWQSKYGYDFVEKDRRDADLASKYFRESEDLEGSDKVIVKSDRENYEEVESKYLTPDFIKVLEDRDKDGVFKHKRLLEAEYPEDLERVEALFGLFFTMRSQEKLDEQGGFKAIHNGETRRGIAKDLTENMFLLSHYLLNGKEVDIKNFWKMAGSMAETAGFDEQTFTGCKVGAVTQVAAYKVLEALGQSPKLSHPKEDAFDAVDMWTEGNTAVQIKGRKYEEKPSVLKVDAVAEPAIELADDDRKVLLNSHLMWESAKFRTKIDKLSERSGREIRGLMMVIPYKQVDSDTGTPSEELVEFFRNYKMEQDGAAN